MTPFVVFTGRPVGAGLRQVEPTGRRWEAKAAVWDRAADWKSYDFGSNNGRQNLFAFPLGPGPADDRFGKDDDIRGHVLAAVRDAFSRDEIVRTMALYPERERFAAAIAADRDRFLTALEAAGGKMEPVTACVNLFDRELDVRLAAAEVGLRVETFQERLGESRRDVRRIFGPLLTGETGRRDVMDGHCSDLAAAISRGDRPVFSRLKSPEKRFPGAAALSRAEPAPRRRRPTCRAVPRVPGPGFSPGPGSFVRTSSRGVDSPS